jgi:hypothetical protein
MYNCFLNSFLQIFYSSLPLKELPFKSSKNLCITPGIKISCRCKRDLYQLYRNSNDETFKNYYRHYCKILKNVTREAKKKHYNRQVLKSSNKIRTVWNIIKLVTGKLTKVNPIQELKIKGEVISNRQAIADSLNSFFVSVAENNLSKYIKTDNKPLDYL